MALYRSMAMATRLKVEMLTEMPVRNKQRGKNKSFVSVSGYSNSYTSNFLCLIQNNSVKSISLAAENVGF